MIDYEIITDSQHYNKLNKGGFVQHFPVADIVKEMAREDNWPIKLQC